MKNSDIVFYPEKGSLRKFFSNRSQMERELCIYERKWHFIPDLLDHGIDFIELEWIQGSTLWELEKIDFAALGDLYALLHEQEVVQKKVICHIDTNPANLIFDKFRKKYFLLDFVDWRWEIAEYDIIHFLLFFCGNKSEAEFKKIISCFCLGYQKRRMINRFEWNNVYQRVCSDFDQRRKLHRKIEKYPGKDHLKNRAIIRNFNY